MINTVFFIGALSYIVQKTAGHLYPQLGKLVSNLAVMTAAFALLLIQLNLSCPADGSRPRLRRRLMLFAAAVITMTCCFGAAGPLPARLGDFGGLYQAQPVLLACIGVYIAFLGTALGELLLLSVRYARVARHRRYLHAGWPGYPAAWQAPAADHRTAGAVPASAHPPGPLEEGRDVVRRQLLPQPLPRLRQTPGQRPRAADPGRARPAARLARHRA